MLTAQGLLARTDGTASNAGGDEDWHDRNHRFSCDHNTWQCRRHYLDRARSPSRRPELPMTSSGHSIAGAPVSEYCSLDRNEKPVGIMGIPPASTDQSAGADSDEVTALGTALGVVKRLTSDVPVGKDIWDVIALKPSDRVVGATTCSDEDHLVFVTSNAQLLHFPAGSVRPQGRTRWRHGGYQIGGRRRGDLLRQWIRQGPTL